MSRSAFTPAAWHHAWPRAAVLLAGLAALGLLWAIGTAVRQAVRQGVEGRRATALQAEADWRCRTLRIRPERERCLALVRERKPWDSAGVQAIVIESGSASSPP